MKLRYRKRALADIEAIYDYISPHDQKAAKGVVKRIEQAIGRLVILRPSGSGRGNTPSGRVSDETIDIIAVFHTARRRRR
jgi:plasmid stabilization system protein ParE